LERTEQHRTVGLEVNLEIVAESDAETIEELAWLAEDMCYVMQAVKNPVEAKLNLTVKGQAAGQD
jgi:organic hydroperoxide reductase OsmC/OhrA